MIKPLVCLVLVATALAASTGCMRQPAPVQTTVTVTPPAQAAPARPSTSTLPEVGKQDACDTYQKTSDAIFKAETGFDKLTDHEGWKYAEPGVRTALSDAVSGERLGANKLENALKTSTYPKEMVDPLTTFIADVRALAQSLEDEQTSDVISQKAADLNQATKTLDTYCGIK